MNSKCPTITPISGECEGSFSGLGFKIYIGEKMPDGSLPKMEDMVEVETSLSDDCHIDDDATWKKEGFTHSFNMTVSPEDIKKHKEFNSRIWGTGGLTRKRIVRERKAYNFLRRNIKNPKRKLLPLYEEGLHKVLISKLYFLYRYNLK